MRHLKRLLILLGAVLAWLLLVVCWPFTAMAAGVPVGPDSPVDSLFTLDAFYVELLLGSAIPFLVSWVTGSDTAAWFKKIAAMFLSAVTGWVTVGLTANGDWSPSSAATKAAILAFVAATVSYVNFVRKTKVERVLQGSFVAIGPKAA